MLNFGGMATRVYLAAQATDMRKGYDGLYGLVRNQLEGDPQSGHLFVFTNRTHTRIKILVFDGSGLWICAKRLERGHFDWPKIEDGAKCMELSMTRLAALLDGLDLAEIKQHKWWRKKAA